MEEGGRVTLIIFYFNCWVESADASPCFGVLQTCLLTDVLSGQRKSANAMLPKLSH